mmetsp:Transcript_12339/g.16958  ORF Transcript_12339/g.16958 Transcript_12339/m.16958 type:complete len:381 (+) Transcript_12339:425-1567(+)
MTRTTLELLLLLIVGVPLVISSEGIVDNVHLFRCIRDGQGGVGLLDHRGILEVFLRDRYCRHRLVLLHSLLLTHFLFFLTLLLLCSNPSLLFLIAIHFPLQLLLLLLLFLFLITMMLSSLIPFQCLLSIATGCHVRGLGRSRIQVEDRPHRRQRHRGDVDQRVGGQTFRLPVKTQLHLHEVNQDGLHIQRALPLESSELFNQLRRNRLQLRKARLHVLLSIAHLVLLRHHLIDGFFGEQHPLVDVLLSFVVRKGHQVPVLGLLTQFDGQRNRLEHAAVFFEWLQEANIGGICLYGSQFRDLLKKRTQTNQAFVIFSCSKCSIALCRVSKSRSEGSRGMDDVANPSENDQHLLLFFFHKEREVMDLQVTLSVFHHWLSSDG